MSSRCPLTDAQLRKFKEILLANISKRIPPGPEFESQRASINGIKIEKSVQCHFSFCSRGTAFVIEKMVGIADSKDPLAPLPDTQVVLFDGKDTYLIQSEGRLIEKYSGLNLAVCRLVPFVGVDYRSISFLSPYKESTFYKAFPPPQGLVLANAASLSEGAAYNPRPSTLKIVDIKGIPAVEMVYLGTPGHAYETYSQSKPIVLNGHVIYAHSTWTEYVVDAMLNDLFPRLIRETEVEGVSTKVGSNVFKLSTYARAGAQIDENPNTPLERRTVYGVGSLSTEIPSSHKPSAMTAPAIINTLRKAHSDHKKVLLVFGASWCLGCNQLNKFLELQGVAAILKKHFIIEHISVSEPLASGHTNTPGGDELMSRFGLGDAGLPSYAFLDDAGRVLSSSKTSNEDGSNAYLGFPISAGDIPVFLKLFKSADPTLSSEELWKLRKALYR